MILHKRFISKVLLLVVLLSVSYNGIAQEETNGLDVILSPRITIGYTFGTGINCGFDLGVGVYRINDIMTGLNLSYYIVFTERGNHRLKGVTLAAESKYVSGKVGIGMVSRKWGLRNVNKAKTPGIMVEATASADAYSAPWVGIKTFIFDRSKWNYYEMPTYTSAYTYFKSQDIEIYKQEPISTDGQ